jgi:hypothetical protein
MLAYEPPDPRDDVYSLGCVVYEMLAGRHPWGNVTAPEAAERKLRPSRPAGLRRHRWAVLRRSLSFSAADRPADAEAFLTEFFPHARPRRLLPWIVAAFAGGMAAGMALRGDWYDPPVTEAPATIREAIEAPAPVVAPPRADETPESEEMPVTEVPIEANPEPAAAPAGPASATPVPVLAAPASLSFAAERFRVTEGEGALRLELRRPAGYAGSLNVHWRTVDETARDGVDFSGSTGWQWAGALPGVPSLVIFIPIVDDNQSRPDVTFRVELEETPEGPAVGAPATAQVTIADDD